jgi:Ser/Thr protein kinase RdoA (MazF antagonist)
MKMQPPGTRAATSAAVAVGRGLGLRIAEPVLLGDHHNVLVWLRPSPYVARVATRTALVRGPEILAESVALARFLAEAGLPVTWPAREVEPGPHLFDGWQMTLWEHVENDPAHPDLAHPDPAQVGHSLRVLHEAARLFPGELTAGDPASEVRRICRLVEAYRPAEAEQLRAAVDGLSLPALETQPLHGDAHLDNVLSTPRGLLWSDWEECWRGPIAWDLACLDHRRRVFGELEEPISAALQAYGPHDEEALAAYARLVATWAAAWGVLHAAESGELSPRTARRLAWIKGVASTDE